MASRRSEIFLGQRTSDPSSADEIPKVPHLPLLQKLIKCDVPDISVVSDEGSEAGNIFDSGRHRKMHYPSIPILHSKCNGEFLTEETSRSEGLNKVHFKDILSSEVSDKDVYKQYTKTSRADAVLSKDISENSVLPITGSESPALRIHPLQSPDAWEYLKRQDVKLDTIQEQVSRILAQNELRTFSPSITSDKSVEGNLPALQNGCTDRVSTTGSTCLSAHKEELLIKCLLAQSEQIQKLQEQVNWLLLKTEQLSLNTSGNERTAVTPDVPNITSNRNPIFEGHHHRLLEVADEQRNSVETAVCHQETEVTKQSTSTMTSLTFNGNDKFVIHKKLTVVTDSSKYQKEVSAQCSYTKNGVDSPEQQPPAKNTVSSAKRSGGKPKKSTKCSPKCNCSKNYRVPSSSSELVSPDEELIQTSPTRNESPLVITKTQDEQRGQLQNMDSKIEKYIPNYENILKNVNEMISENATENLSPPPSKKTTPKSTSRPRDKHTSVPRTAKSPTIQNRKEENKRLPGQRSSSASSNTSLNSVQGTPEFKKPKQQRTAPSRTKPTKKEEEFSTALRYGLSSPNLSVATKQYLENYGLVQDKSSESEKIKSSKKTRTSLTKRYPR